MAPEVLGTSSGANAPAVVALRAPLHHFAVPNLTPGPNKGVEEDRENPVLKIYELVHEARLRCRRLAEIN